MNPLTSHRIPLTIAALLVTALAFSGCGASATTPVSALPVKGKITYKGQPLIKGQVGFEPEGAGREAFGDINEDGTFELTTYSKGDGAVPGKHRVSITGATGKRRADIVPAKYNNYGSSNLEAEVSPDKAEYSFDLK